MSAISLVLHSGKAGTTAAREERLERLSDDNRTLSTIQSPSPQFPGDPFPSTPKTPGFTVEGPKIIAKPAANAGLSFLRVDGAYGATAIISSDSQAAGLAVALEDDGNVWVATPNAQFSGWAIEHYVDNKLISRDVAGIAPTGDKALATLRWNADLLELIVNNTQLASLVIDGPAKWAGLAATRPVPATFYSTAIHIKR